MNGLSFLKRDSAGGVLIAAYHNPQSLTWGWLLSWSFYREGFPHKWGLSIEPIPHIQVRWRFGFGRLGYLYFASQEPMWR
jgi:hypothetical protein